MADVCQDLGVDFQAIGAALTVDVAAGPTLAFAEKNLRSIFLNLLSNALKYRDPDRVPQLAPRCHLVGAFAVLEVQDNGLDPTQQKKALRPLPAPARARRRLRHWPLHGEKDDGECRRPHRSSQRAGNRFCFPALFLPLSLKLRS